MGLVSFLPQVHEVALPTWPGSLRGLPPDCEPTSHARAGAGAPCVRTSARPNACVHEAGVPLPVCWDWQAAVATAPST